MSASSFESPDTVGPDGPRIEIATLAPPGYEILSELGRGGMGVVYRAQQRSLDRIVALKMILRGGHADAEELARFRREAQAIAQLQHPNIVQVHEVGEQDGKPFFSLEYCPGGSLDRLLAGKPVTADEAVPLLRTLALAVQSAHERGVIHRDLKPANVLLTEPRPLGSGSDASAKRQAIPKITDFGLARRLDDALQTASGAVMGTPSYMPPEQAQGKVHEIGPAVDVYALGAILYECLTGRPPFLAATAMDTLLQVMHDDPVPPRTLNPTVPIDVETICLKCLHKEAGKRYTSCNELAEDLRRWLDKEPILARPIGSGERLAKWVKRRPMAASLVGVSLFAALALAGLTVVALQQRQAAVRALGRVETALAQMEAEQKAKALAQVGALRVAAAGAVPAILRELRENRAEVLPHLKEFYDAEPEDGKRMRLALALVEVEPEAVKDKLAAWLLQAPDPAEVGLVRDALAGHGEELKERLWTQARNTDAPAAARLRALSALATFDRDNASWKDHGALAAEQMLQANPLHLGIWAEALRPVRQALRPKLGDVYRDKRLTESRQVAATVLADYLAQEPEQLAELLIDGDDRQFALLLPLLRANVESSSGRLLRELKPTATKTEAEQSQQAQRQAAAALGLMRLGKPEATWELWRHTATPERRSWLVARAAAVGVEAQQLIARLEQEKDVSAKRALIVALGEYTDKDLPAAEREPVVKKLLTWYREDADAGIHGAIDWLLRHGQEGPEKRRLDWGQAKELARIDAELAARTRAWTAALAAGQIGVASRGPLAALASGGREPPVSRGWTVNGQGMTLTLSPGPVEFVMGSPKDEAGRRDDDENQHRRRINRSFAIGTKAVTVAQWEQFLKERPKVARYNVKQWSPEANCPMVAVDWYDAAKYCNWLSEKEGIPKEQWCYPEDIGDGKKMPAGYLKRAGYRLATEAEWEYACRAGAITSRHYGSSVDLLGRYALYIDNSKEPGKDMRSWPVGQKRPNDLGLFDLHGNIWTWVQNAYYNYPDSGLSEDKEDIGDIKDLQSRLLRGGSFFVLAPYVRCAYRNGIRPDFRFISFGVRVARTYHFTFLPFYKPHPRNKDIGDSKTPE